MLVPDLRGASSTHLHHQQTIRHPVSDPDGSFANPASPRSSRDRRSQARPPLRHGFLHASTVSKALRKLIETDHPTLLPCRLKDFSHMTKQYPEFFQKPGDSCLDAPILVENSKTSMPLQISLSASLQDQKFVPGNNYSCTVTRNLECFHADT